VVLALLTNGPPVRADLVAQTNLSAMTVNLITKDLVEDGQVAEVGRTSGQVGQPASTPFIQAWARLWAPIFSPTSSFLSPATPGASTALTL